MDETMTGHEPYDAVVVGAGPNGLAAAVELARNGRRVAVLEAEEEIGGGTRSAGLTLPGYVHALGSAIHPLGYASPFFSSLPLEEHGLEWVHPPAPLAHPLDDGTAVVEERPVEETAAVARPGRRGLRSSHAPARRRRREDRLPLSRSEAASAPFLGTRCRGAPFAGERTSRGGGDVP